MKKEDFLVEMDDDLYNGVHTPGNLPPEFDWKFFDSTSHVLGGGTRGRLDHTYYLFHYASVLPDNSLIVEIGTAYVESTIAMGMGIRGKNSNIIAIDPGFMPIEAISKRAREIYKYEIQLLDIDVTMDVIRKAKLEKHITLVGETSDKAFEKWDGRPIDMLHIDGSHKYEHVKIDCQWLKHVRPGGIVIFDDWMDSVKKAAWEYLADKPEWELITESTTQPPRHPWKTVYWKNVKDDIKDNTWKNVRDNILKTIR